MRLPPVLILHARAEARAMLWRECEYQTFQDAVLPLLIYAERARIPPDLTLQILDEVFDGQRSASLSGMANADSGIKG